MVQCLRNGLGKRLSRCAPCPGRPERVVSGAARGSPGKKPGFNGPPRGGRLYTSIDWEAKMEIPDKISHSRVVPTCGGPRAMAL